MILRKDIDTQTITTSMLLFKTDPGAHEIMEGNVLTSHYIKIFVAFFC